MNLDEALQKLEHLRDLIDRFNPIRHESTDEQKELARQIYSAYGEVEDVIERYAGRQEVRVRMPGGAVYPVYPNYIEAGYLSGTSAYSHQGYTQLLKVIGKVRQAIEADPRPPRDERSVGSVLGTLRRFRECCQYLTDPPKNERAVQDIVWIMLRSQFDRLDREDTLPKYGVKAYRPDFGIPELRVLLEVKFIGENTRLSDTQEEILADVPGYLAEHSRYDGIIVFVYDAAHKLRDATKFIEDLRTADGIIDVLVVPGLG